ncbi:hypothetical protein Mame01_39330 [Microbispora amethystogenes]|nr:hypothetical protein Mame01_39330 [Microbispora amethystogenes]
MFPDAHREPTRRGEASPADPGGRTQDRREKWRDSDLVFTTRNGTPVEPRNFNRAVTAHCRRAGVPVIRVHDTRHTCASLLAALDVHPRVAMRILRHSQISMTMDVYAQIPTPETRAALDRLNRSLDNPSES